MTEEEDVEFQVWLWAIPRFVLLILIILAVVFLVRFFVISRIDTFETESTIIIDRILYSPTGIIYYDREINRPHPGIINVTKLKTEVLENSLLMPNNQYFAVRLTLKDMEDNLVMEAYANKIWYERWLPRVDYPGAGGTRMKNKEVYVLYKEKGLTKPGILKISVIIPS